MDDKVWWQSKTIWGSILSFIAMALSYFNINLDVGLQAEIVNLIIGAVGAVLTVYGRLKASGSVKLALF